MTMLVQMWTLLLNALHTRLVLVALIAVAAFLFSRGILSMFSWVVDPIRRRLGTLSKAQEKTSNWTSSISALVQPVSRFVMPTSDKELGTMQERFTRAGFQSPDAPAVFYGLKTVLAALFFAAVMFASPLLPKLSSSRLMFYAGLAPNGVVNWPPLMVVSVSLVGDPVLSALRDLTCSRVSWLGEPIWR